MCRHGEALRDETKNGCVKTAVEQIKKKLIGTDVVTGPSDNPGSVLKFIVQGYVEFISNRATVIKGGKLSDW